MRPAWLLLLCLLSAEARADPHRHTWGDETCLAESCIRGCCQQTCWAPCTYPDCSVRDPRNKTSGRCPPPPGEGSFGGGGATGSYSTGLSLMSIDPEPMSPWSPRPGASPGAACNGGKDHDWGDEQCGPWSSPLRGKSTECRIRHCDSRCKRCGTNGQSRTEQDPPGCLSAAKTAPHEHREEDHDVAMVSSPWGPRPGGAGSDACPPHDWPSSASCGGWSRISDKCRVKHCTYQCKKCLTNGRDYYEQDPSGCLDD